MMRLYGDCNGCGQCCAVEHRDHGLLVCEHLERTGELGTSGATRCRVYADRTDGMPITMLDVHGRRYAAHCLKGPREAEIIVRRGFGRGCSLRIAAAPDQVPLMQFIPKGA